MTTHRLRRALSICVLPILMAGAGLSGTSAATGRVWNHREASDYNSARLDKVTVSQQGRISLAPAVERMADVSQLFLWCLVTDGAGRVYAGGGNEGQVIRIDGGSSEVVFDAPEVEVHALAVDSEDRLYVGTSPDGKVYRVAPGAEPEVFFDPEATYIWALAFDARGHLLVATGQPGRVVGVSPEGRPRTLLESREVHIRSLAADGDEGFVAGSDGGGVIYRIDANGDAEVLFDTPEHEISALAVADGRIYAAALSPTRKGQQAGAQSETRGNVTTVRVTADGGGDAGNGEGESQQQSQAARRRQRAQVQYTGSIYTITTEGYARKVWSSPDRLPLSMLPGPGGGVLVGTSGGRILALNRQGDSSELTALESEQVNALLDSGSGGVYAVTSNLAAIFRVTDGYAQEGTVTGGVRDAGFTSRWGAITWDGSDAPGSAIHFEVRTGDTEAPDGTWSDWTGPYREPRGSVITNPPARFLQWRATLTSSSGESSPILRSVQVHYMPENMPPVMETVEVLDPGVWLQPSGPARRPRGSRPATPPAPKRASQHGMRSVQWTASDDNQDPLDAEVLFKAEDETVWKVMGSAIQEGFFAWDSRAMPDGLYRVRVRVDDAPGNPAGQGLSSHRDSAAFEVDNTPPAVSEVEARLKDGRAEVTAVVTDSFSVVGALAYSVDAGDWIVLLPRDGVADSASEVVLFTTAPLSPGEHSVVIRASDRSGNLSSGKTLIRVP